MECQQFSSSGEEKLAGFTNFVSSLDPDAIALQVILSEFESFHLLNTYVPNNGWKVEETSFLRSRKWDKRILEFVVQSCDKLLIWCGDLNVRYRGKSMRIDSFIVSEALKGRIVASEIQSQGVELKRFYGRDHGPVSLELSGSSSDPTKAKLWLDQHLGNMYCTRHPFDQRLIAFWKMN